MEKFKETWKSECACCHRTEGHEEWCNCLDTSNTLIRPTSMENFNKKKLAEFNDCFLSSDEEQKYDSYPYNVSPLAHIEIEKFISDVIDSSFRAGEEAMKKKVLKETKNSRIFLFPPYIENGTAVAQDEDGNYHKGMEIDLENFLKLQ